LNPDIRIHITRAHIWAAAHEVSGDGMASVGGDVAGDDRNDFEVGALGSNEVKMAAFASASAPKALCWPDNCKPQTRRITPTTLRT
jgi:hypothetical protein